LLCLSPNLILRIVAAQLARVLANLRARGDQGVGTNCIPPLSLGYGKR
jgi:hypothetical protein